MRYINLRLTYLLTYEILMSVCLSVRLSVTFHRHNFFTILQPNHSSFTRIKHFREIPTGLPPQGC